MHLRHSALRPAYHALHDLIKVFSGYVIHNQYKVRIIIEETAIVGDVLQIDLQSITQPFAFHGIHFVQSTSCKKHHLKFAIYIQIRKQYFTIILLIVWFFNCMDQGSGDLFVRSTL